MVAATAIGERLGPTRLTCAAGMGTAPWRVWIGPIQQPGQVQIVLTMVSWAHEIGLMELQCYQNTPNIFHVTPKNTPIHHEIKLNLI